jgi:hypothetical protein
MKAASQSAMGLRGSIPKDFKVLSMGPEYFEQGI